jgi:uncharacterized protein with gpF-like domain
MAHAKVKLMPHKLAWVNRFNVPQLKGAPLYVSASISTRYNAALQKAISVMIKETIDAVNDLDNFAEDGIAMDASPASQARIVMNALSRKFNKMFAQLAAPVAQKMVEETDANSATTLKASVKDIAGTYALKTDILTTELNDILTASVQVNVDLIKRVPQKYLDQVKGDVLRSIQSGRGTADLVPALEKQGVTVRNWAHNVALDQTRKAYNAINAGRMSALGIDDYEWIHSGGSNHPRSYHKNVLNGTICKLSDPPVIQKAEGSQKEVRGKPGDLPFCGCAMRPVLIFKDD